MFKVFGSTVSETLYETQHAAREKSVKQ